jgi:hypothetical protein
MFIDTEAANRASKVRVEIASRSPEPSSQAQSPLLTSFVGQGPPPSYLEATTPNFWNARPSGDEEARLLSFDGRPSPAPVLADPLEGIYKGPMYKRRAFREHCSRARMIKWVAAILGILLLAAILTVVTRAPRDVSITIRAIRKPMFITALDNDD